MSVLFPELISAPGQLKLALVDSIADLAAPKLATEINAVTSLDISCFVISEGWGPNSDQAKGTAPRRVCTVASQETLGTASETLPDLLYAWDPQGAGTVDANKLYTKATPGTTKFIVARYGLVYTAAWAVGQFVDVHKVKFGVYNPQAPIGDDNGVLHMKQALINVTTVTRKVALAA